MKYFIQSVIFFLSTSIISAQQVDLVNYLPKNYVEDGSVDYTNYIQKGLDENDTLSFPDFPILINEKGLKLKSNQVLNFSDQSMLCMEPNNREKYALLQLEGISNVIINNPVLRGDRDNHTGNKGEWGMGINVLSSANVTINNPNISKFWGDGIYIGEISSSNNRFKKKGPSKNVVISGGIIDHNRRNGISVISIKGLVIRDIQIQNTEGTNPMAGIDIEPNNNNQFLEDIDILNVKTKNNKKVGLKYVVGSFLGKRERDVNINVENFIDEGSETGIHIGGVMKKNLRKKSRVQKLKGEIHLRKVSLLGNEIPIRYGSIQKYNPKVTFEKLKFIDKNNIRKEKEERTIIKKLSF